MKEVAEEEFKEALKNTCQWFLDNYPNVRGVE